MYLTLNMYLNRSVIRLSKVFAIIALVEIIVIEKNHIIHVWFYRLVYSIPLHLCEIAFILKDVQVVKLCDPTL